MGKKVEKEKNEIVEEFFRRNDSKNIKSMNDMYAAWKDFFAPAFQQLLDAEMEAKIGYSKNERTDNNKKYLHFTMTNCDSTVTLLRQNCDKTKT